MKKLKSFSIQGMETGTILRLEETVEGDQIVVSITRYSSQKNDIATIRLDAEGFSELCSLRYDLGMK